MINVNIFKSVGSNGHCKHFKCTFLWHVATGALAYPTPETLARSLKNDFFFKQKEN